MPPDPDSIPLATRPSSPLCTCVLLSDSCVRDDGSGGGGEGDGAQTSRARPARVAWAIVPWIYAGGGRVSLELIGRGAGAHDQVHEQAESAQEPRGVRGVRVDHQPLQVRVLSSGLENLQSVGSRYRGYWAKCEFISLGGQAQRTAAPGKTILQPHLTMFTFGDYSPQTSSPWQFNLSPDLCGAPPGLHLLLHAHLRVGPELDGK